jgi:hypothetical protein
MVKKQHNTAPVVLHSAKTHDIQELDIERPPAEDVNIRSPQTLLDGLTLTEAKTLRAIVETDTYDAAGKLLGIKGNSVRYRIVSSPRLQKAMEMLPKATLLSIMQYAPRAVENVMSLSNSAKDEDVRLRASKDILDRAGLAVQKGNSGTAVQINNLIGLGNDL